MDAILPKGIVRTVATVWLFPIRIVGTWRQAHLFTVRRARVEMGVGGRSWTVITRRSSRTA